MSATNPNAFATSFLPLTGGTISGTLTAQTLATSLGPVNIVQGNLDIQTIGKGIGVAEGTNAKQGIATLVAGTVTVANTSVTANSKILVTCQILGTVTSASTFDTPRVVGTSFTIHASQATDTSTVAWEIFEPG